MLSIIIMTRNEEKLIGRMLQSILIQNFKDEYEVIVVDAHSVDRTREIITKYFGLLPIRIVDGLGRGIGADRNLGGSISKGDLLFFTEGDCFLNRGLLEKLSEIFTDNDLVAWSSIALPNHSKWFVQLTYWFYDVCRYFLSKIPYPFKGYSTSGAIIVVRKLIFTKLGGFMEGGDMNDDGELGRKIRDYCEFTRHKFSFNINPKIVVYRSMGRFNRGYFSAMNHYVYVLVNFVPFLERLLKNQMKYEGVVFQDEKN